MSDNEILSGDGFDELLEKLCGNKPSDGGIVSLVGAVYRAAVERCRDQGKMLDEAGATEHYKSDWAKLEDERDRALAELAALRGAPAVDADLIAELQQCLDDATDEHGASVERHSVKDRMHYSERIKSLTAALERLKAVMIK